MRIVKISTTPLRVPYHRPFHWAQGEIQAAEVVLIEVHTDEGIVGYGESMSSGSATSVEKLIHEVSALLVGQNPLEITRLMARAYQHLFAARGTCSAPRFGALVLTGLDLALWDVSGKAAGRAVYDLLGGACRNSIRYFGFAQGETADEVAENALEWANSGCDVIYTKVGRGNALDIEIATKVRASIGHRRLRLDANEAWDILTAKRMIKAFESLDVEFLEQPTSSDSLSALGHVHAGSSIAIAADQIAFTPQDVFAVCRSQSADLIVLGLHETGTVTRFIKAGAIAEAAGLNVCLHGLYETGITTCATNQVGALLPNLDDGNQYMNHFLREDILCKPGLTLKEGRLPVISGPGWGFEINWDAVARAEEAHRENDTASH